MTTPTSNPVPSNDARDLLFNAAKIDEAVNSSAQTYVDRMGKVRLTLAGMSSAAGDATLAIQAAESALSSKNASISASATATSAADVAVTSRDQSLVAKAAAEAARDAASLSSGVYADTAAGLAATPNGRYFSVPSASSAEYLNLYKNNAGTAALQKTYPSIEGVAAKIGYQRVLTNSDNIDTTTPIPNGTYVLGTNSSRPAGTFPSGYDAANIGFLMSVQASTHYMQILSESAGDQFWIRYHRNGFSPTAWLEFTTGKLFKRLSLTTENIDSLTTEGDYLVTLNSNPGTYPPGTLPSSFANVSVRGTVNNYTQTLTYTETEATPHKVWSRMYYYGGWTDWRELTFEWAESVLTNATDLSATTLLKRGAYLMGTGSSAPSGLPAGYDAARTGILNVSVYNSVAFEMLSNMYSSNAWVRTRTSGLAPTPWAKVGPEAFYKRVLSDSENINSLHAEGAYIVNSTLSPGDYPDGMPTYGILEVNGSGLFVSQTMTAAQGAYARPRVWTRNWQTSYGQSAWVEMTNPLVPEPVDPSQPLFGKKIVFLGDSITQGLMGSLPDQFPSYVATRTGATCINFGVGGTQMATHTTAPDYGPFSFWALAEALTTGVWTTQDAKAATIGHTSTVAAMKALDWSTVDFVVVAYGHNDRSNGVAVGTNTSTNDANFYGAMRNGLTDLLTEWPHLQVLMVCPYDRLSATGTIAPFVSAIQDVCENEFRIPFIDLYRSSGITNFTKSVFLHSDQLHPSRVGYKYLGNKIGGWLLSVI